MDNLSGPSDPRDQAKAAKPADDSGPGDPRDNEVTTAARKVRTRKNDPARQSHLRIDRVH